MGSDHPEANAVVDKPNNGGLDPTYRNQLYENFSSNQPWQNSANEKAQQYLPSIKIGGSDTSNGNQTADQKPEGNTEKKTGGDMKAQSGRPDSDNQKPEGPVCTPDDPHGDGTGGGKGDGKSKEEDRTIKNAFEQVANKTATKSYNSVGEAVSDAISQNNQTLLDAQRQAEQIRQTANQPKIDNPSQYLEKPVIKPNLNPRWQDHPAIKLY